MLFPTVEFAILFALVLPLSWALMPRPHAWKPVMLAVSYAFYAAADWRFCLLLGGITVGNQLAARAIARVGGGEARAGRRICAAAVTADLAVLGVFKYYGFFVDEINGTLGGVGLGLPLPLATLALPVGVSFFTFQAISYVVDVKRGLVAPAPLLDVALYLSFFPHLVAGPIVRAREFLPQLERPRDPARVAVGAGVMLIAVGLVKKIALADVLAREVVDPVFAVPEAYGSADVLLASSSASTAGSSASGPPPQMACTPRRRSPGSPRGAVTGSSVASPPWPPRPTAGRASPPRRPALDCGDRLEVVVPARVKRRAVLAVTVVDRFLLGGARATVCAGRQGARARCKTVAVTAAAPAATARFRAGGDAVWRVRVRHQNGRIERVLTVGAAERPADAKGLPSLLITGDSIIQGVDAFLGDRLQTAFDVTSDTRPGTGLVKPAGVDWPALARAQAAKLRPAVTILSLGVNDGVPIGDVKCCGPAWSNAYGDRARRVMRSYARGGKGRVLWLRLPVPRDPRFAEITRAVNLGLRQAAADQPRVTLIALDELLTPGDRYRDAMPVNGRSVRVRAGDGIHLSVAGARYVAGIVVATLRRFRATG